MELEEAVSKGRTHRLGAGKLLGFAGSWAREHQDQGLDPADAQHSQQHSLGTGSGRDGAIAPDTFLDGSWVAALQGPGAGCPRGGASAVPGEQRCWGLAPLLGPRPLPGDQGSSSSICTEDFADRFGAGAVRALLSEEEEEEEEEAAAGGGAGRDAPLLPTGRSPGFRPHSVRGRSPRPVSGGSLESLGGRISRLSRSGALGVTGGGARPGPSPHPSRPLGASPHGRGRSGITWRGEGKDPAAGCPRGAPGTAAGRSRGSAGGPLPGTGCGSSGEHRSSQAPVLLQREPPQEQHGGNGARAVHGSAKGGAGSSWVRAPCAPPRPTASGPLGGCGAGADGSPCPAGAARWQHGKQEVVLPCKGRQEGTWNTGAAAKGTWSKVDRARAGLDACCWDPMGLERMSPQGQRACECCQEGLEMERRKTTALQEEKLELQKRLRELEHRSRSLLQQRQEVLRRLHVLLLQEKVDALRQLQEALEQQVLLKERAVGTTRLQHRLSHPWEQAGSCPAMGTTSVCPCQHNLHPSAAMGQGPVLAAVSRALRVLCGLREQIQQHIRELQREPRDVAAEGGR